MKYKPGAFLAMYLKSLPGKATWGMLTIFLCLSMLKGMDIRPAVVVIFKVLSLVVLWAIMTNTPPKQKSYKTEPYASRRLPRFIRAWQAGQENNFMDYF